MGHEKKAAEEKATKRVEKVVRIHGPPRSHRSFLKYSRQRSSGRVPAENFAEAEEACFSEFELQAEKYHR